MTEGINPWTFDLCAPLPKTKRPKKDHKCVHDRKHPTGMEVCEKCGDYGICGDCGMEYIKRDSGRDGICWMCDEVIRLRMKLADRVREQQKRQAEYRQVTS